MTAINKDGQVYFTFDDLDFDGALKDVVSDLHDLLDELDFCNFGTVVYKRITRQIDDLQKVALYLERLKRGQRYV